jgi:hypothetical protein
MRNLNRRLLIGVSRQTVLKIVDILSKIPVRPEVAALVGLGAVEQNGSAKKKSPKRVA